MSEWRFILINSEGEETQVDDPRGWEDVTVNIDRDSNWHGIFFGYSFSKLEFYGEGAMLLKEEYEANGVDGQMNLRLEFQCSEEGLYDTFYEGKLAFDQYSDTCGSECMVSVGLEDTGDVMLMRNNYEQKVNLNSNIAFDEVTTLADYDGLNFDLEVPSRGIPIRSDGSNNAKQSFDLLEFPGLSGLANAGITGTQIGATLPIFSVNTNSEIQITNINSIPYYDNTIRFNNGEDGSVGTPPFIDFSKNTTLKCVPSDFNFSYRIKGRLQDITNATRLVDVNFYIGVGPDPANVVFTVDAQLMLTYDAGTPVMNEYDISGSGIANVQPGDKVYVFIRISYQKLSTAVLQFLIMEFDEETEIEFHAISYCESTTTKSCFINEAISRTIEAITNDKIRFYSTYFGRIDSQPYALLAQTCAGLFAVSNGLNVRRRLLQDNSQPGFFVTLKSLFEELKAIWNIGLTIDPDLNRAGFNRLRFEDWRYFYQEDVGIIFNYPEKITRTIDNERLYNRIAVGYNKWTAEQYSGLDEFMTKRSYRININAISKELEANSDIITAPYTIEITRRLDTGTDDWQYDNDIFGFCLKYSGGQYSVETFADAAYAVEHVNDPNSCYNGRISPERNAMRWFNYIMQGLRNIDNNSKLIFTSGEANYIAKFGLNNCNIEGQPIAENDSISIASFDDQTEALPITFPETLTFDHPLNYNLFKQIKNDPTLKFKSINVRCNGTDNYAWIKSISYRPNEGMATIVAIPKNTVQLPPVVPPEACAATIVDGSVTMDNFDWEAGTADIDFTEGGAGGTLWSYIITEGSTPGAGTGFSGTTTAHPFTVSGITPGTWSVFIVPYCSETEVGQNYGAGTFEMPAPPFAIELSAVLTTGLQPFNKLKLTAKSVGNVPAPAGFTFNWGQCVYNTSTHSEACRAFPSSILPSPTNTFTFNTGDTEITQDSVTNVAGADFGYITKIVLFNLSGITSADITKAAGQGWTLDYE